MVLEMMDRLNGNLKYTAEDGCLQERFNKLPPYNTNGILSRGERILAQVCMAFARCRWWGGGDSS